MNIPIINFHGLGEPHSWVEQDEARYWLSKAQFDEALDRIVETGTAALITFDDGNISDLAIGLPALKERGLNATFFVCSAKIGLQGYLGAADVRTLAQDAAGVGSHGRSHSSWRGIAASDLKREIAGSKRELEDIINRPVTSAALPFGQYDSAALAQLRVAGFRQVFSSDGGPRMTSSWLQPRYSIRGDLKIRPQIDRCFAAGGLAMRLMQEARMTVKAMR